MSVVTTVFRSQTTIVEFVGRVRDVAAAVCADIELLVVDDGSPDRSAEIVRQLVDTDDRIILIQLSRNFGHHRAMLTGLEHSTGDVVFLIDSDLEEAPEHFPEMLRLLSQEKADCVFGVQRMRKGGQFERWSGDLFYRLFGLLSEVKLPRNVTTMRVMTRRYVNSLVKFRDHNPVFVPLAIITGYRQVQYLFDKESTSPTTYSLWKRLSLLMLAVTSFSGRPLELMFSASLVLAAAGFLYGAWVVVQALIGPTQSGWSSIMATIAFFFSLNALFIGVIGLYLKRVLEEIKDRPRTVVQEIYGDSPFKTSETASGRSDD